MILVLAAALVAFAGLTLFLGLAMGRRARQSFEKRLALVGAAAAIERKQTPSRGEQRKAQLAARLRGLFTLGLPRTWGMRARPSALLALGGAGTLTAIALFAALDMPAPVTGLAGLSAFVFLPRLLLLREQSQAEKQFTNLFPDAIDMAIRMLRAGLPITSAIRTIGREAPAPVNAVFSRLGDQVEIGIPFDEALTATGARIGLPDFRFFAVAVALQRATGGNLASTLEILSDIMRKRRAVRLKAQATTAEVRVSAVILGAMPFLVTGALLVVQPGYLAPLITDPRGKFIIGAAIASLAMGFLTMRRMMQNAIRL